MSDQIHAMVSRFLEQRVKIEQRLLDHGNNPISAEEAKQLAMALSGVAEAAADLRAQIISPPRKMTQSNTQTALSAFVQARIDEREGRFAEAAANYVIAGDRAASGLSAAQCYGDAERCNELDAGDAAGNAAEFRRIIAALDGRAA